MVPCHPIQYNPSLTSYSSFIFLFLPLSFFRVLTFLMVSIWLANKFYVYYFICIYIIFVDNILNTYIIQTINNMFVALRQDLKCEVCRRCALPQIVYVVLEGEPRAPLMECKYFINKAQVLIHVELCSELCSTLTSW